MAKDRHKDRPVSLRLGGDGPWLREHAERTGQAVNAILKMLVARYRREQEEEGR